MADKTPSSDDRTETDAQQPPYHVGMRLDDFATVVTAERQRRYHAAAEVPDGLFGDTVDLSILANDTIHATRYLKDVPVDGLHAGQRMTQRRPVRFGERLTLRGTVAQLRPMARGTFVTIAFDFVADGGEVPVTSENVSFQVDPDAMRRQPRPEPTAAPELTGFELVARKHPTEQRVTGYSFEFRDYLVHFEPAAAASVGLPAPVAQGLMSFTWMTEAVARLGAPDRFALDATFRQSVYWDDRIEIQARDEREFRVVKVGGGICSSGELTPLPS